MNEVRTTPTPTVVVPSAASSKGTDGVNVAVKEEIETKLPETQVEPVTSAAPIDKKEKVDIEHAVTEMNDYVQKVQRDLQFSVDKDLGTTVVKVVDMGTGDLIRQIPEEVFLNLARNLKDEQPLQIFDAMG